MIRKAIKDGLLQKLKTGELDKIFNQVSEEKASNNDDYKFNKLQKTSSSGSSNFASTILSLGNQLNVGRIRSLSRNESYKSDISFTDELPQQTTIKNLNKLKIKRLSEMYSDPSFPIIINPENNLKSLSQSIQKQQDLLYNQIKPASYRNRSRKLQNESENDDIEIVIDSMKIDCYNILGNILCNSTISLSLLDIKPDVLLKYCISNNGNIRYNALCGLKSLITSQLSVNNTFLRMLITNYNLFNILEGLMNNTNDIRIQQMILQICIEIIKYPKDVIKSFLCSNLVTIFLNETELSTKEIKQENDENNNILYQSYKRDCKFIINQLLSRSSMTFTYISVNSLVSILSSSTKKSDIHILINCLKACSYIVNSNKSSHYYIFQRKFFQNRAEYIAKNGIEALFTILNNCHKTAYGEYTIEVLLYCLYTYYGIIEYVDESLGLLLATVANLLQIEIESHGKLNKEIFNCCLVIVYQLVNKNYNYYIQFTQLCPKFNKLFQLDLNHNQLLLLLHIHVVALKDKSVLAVYMDNDILNILDSILLLLLFIEMVFTTDKNNNKPIDDSILLEVLKTYLCRFVLNDSKRNEIPSYLSHGADIMKYINHENVSIRLIIIKCLSYMANNNRLIQMTKKVNCNIISDLLRSVQSNYKLESFYATSTLDNLVHVGSSLLFTLSIKDMESFLCSKLDTLKSLGLSVYSIFIFLFN